MRAPGGTCAYGLSPGVRESARSTADRSDMHDNLPLGDLSELLGEIPASAYESDAATASVSTAEQLPQIEPSLSANGLYHIIVVGGQESPGGGVTAGGFNVPNPAGFGSVGWIDILDDYLARGGARRARQHSGAPSLPDLVGSPATTDSAIVETPSSITAPALPLLSSKMSQPPPSAGGRSAPTLEPIVGSTIIRSKDYAQDPEGPQVTLETPSAPLTRQNSNVADKSLPHLRHRASIESIGSISNKSSPATPQHVNFFPPHHAHAQPQRGPYILVAKERLMGIFVCVYVLRSCQKLVTGFDKNKVTTGLVGGRIGNKGCAAISLHFAGQRMLFIIAHLAAHTGGLPIRKANVQKIKDELDINDFSDSQKGHHGARLHRSNSRSGERDQLRDVSERFDFTFFAGDLK